MSSINCPLRNKPAGGPPSQTLTIVKDIVDVDDPMESPLLTFYTRDGMISQLPRPLALTFRICKSEDDHDVLHLILQFIASPARSSVLLVY